MVAVAFFETPQPRAEIPGAEDVKLFLSLPCRHHPIDSGFAQKVAIDFFKGRGAI